MTSAGLLSYFAYLTTVGSHAAARGRTVQERIGLRLSGRHTMSVEQRLLGSHGQGHDWCISLCNLLSLYLSL